jgi:ABC-2 type transport system ATP-binding protein
VIKSAVTIDRVSLSFDSAVPPIFDNLTLNIPCGKIIGLVGPDGAGKTSLLRLLVGLLKPSEGSISVLGLDSSLNLQTLCSKIGYMPQRFSLYEDLTVIQNLELYARLKGVPKLEEESICSRLLQFTNLKLFKNRLAKALSGGMKQKLALACILVTKPQILMLDEPSVGVDPISRIELWKMVKSLFEEDMTVIWSTADLNEAELCDQVIVMQEGKVLFQGDPKDLTNRVDHKVYHIHVPEKRGVLNQALNDSEVVDAVIEGAFIRLVLKQNQSIWQGYSLIPVKPRLEDSFMSLIGKKSFNTSLAETRNPILQTTYAAITAKNLTKKFGDFVASDNLSFEVQKGEIFGLLGPNGAGKSTAFKMLCGLLKPSQGEARVNQLDLQIAPTRARSQLGYMSQKFSLYENLSVMQNLQFFSGAYGLKGEIQKKQIEQMIDIFNLKPYLFHNAITLPVGYKQRLALACANMHEPSILFLDEPTSGVDPATRREFWNHIYGLAEKGVTILVSTHFLLEAEYCDRIALIYHGKVIHLETPDRLKEAARSKEIPNPTLEDAFIRLIQGYDAAHACL